VSDIPPNLIQSLADGELPPESAAQLERRIAADEGLRAEVAAGVRFEHKLQSRVGAVMSESVPGCPPDLADRIRSRLASADRAGVAATVETAPPRWRRLFASPQRASVAAIAASLLLIAGAVLFGIFRTSCRASISGAGRRRRATRSSSGPIRRSRRRAWASTSEPRFRSAI
jgi:anti-sigma factor RsiW